MSEPKGNDRMGNKGDGLKLDWLWHTPGIPSQNCRASVVCLPGFFWLRATKWSDGYDASVGYVDGQLLSSGWNDGKRFSTRIAAQREAERLITRFMNNMEDALRMAGLS